MAVFKTAALNRSATHPALAHIHGGVGRFGAAEMLTHLVSATQPILAASRADVVSSRLCHGSGVVIAHLPRAAILAFGGGIAVNQLDHRHRRGIAVANAGLQNTGIATGP